MSVRQVATLLVFWPHLGPTPLLQSWRDWGWGWSDNETENVRMPTSLRAASPWQPQLGKEASFILNQVWSWIMTWKQTFLVNE